MSGFIRRFGYFPGSEVITQIEGVVIIDTPPPGAVQGTGTGTVVLVGECADASYAVNVTTAGSFTPRCSPVEAFSPQDMLNKMGGFDETIGNFGGAMGNAFVAVRNKRFARLVLAPVDNVTPGAGTGWACRFWRELPTNISATNPAPIVPVTGGVISAGREFRNGSNRARIAKRVVFTDFVAFKTGTDGSVTTAGAAATQVFTSASGDFVNQGVKVGDILVSGVIGTSLGANANTYRITAFTATTLTVQRLDGVNFAFTTEASLPYRVHVASTADTAGAIAAVNVVLSGASGYAVPCRPLDATIAAATTLTPTVAPSAGTATSWDTLSGLTGVTHPTGALTYDANVHAPNAANNATIDARYGLAIDALLSDDYPARDINIGYCARTSSTIRAKGRSHELVASARGLTRRWINSPDLAQQTLQAVSADADPGVGANRDQRLDYAWPGCVNSIPEAVGFTLATSDGKTTADGILDEPTNGWLASVESMLPPERNPGQAAEPVPTVLAPILGFQRGVSNLGLNEYITLRQKGIAALRFDKTVGPIFQSGITTSLLSGEKNIARRRMADFIQDSMSNRLVQFCKLPMTNQLKDGALAELDAFLNELKSPNNPAAQRIDDYQLDDVSGNTPELTASGVYVIIVRVRLLATADFIVLQTEIGEGVTIQQAA